MKRRFMSWLYRTEVYKWLMFKWPKLKYIHYYEKLPIDDKAILVESQHGTEINGNIFYLLKELTTNKDYQGYKIYVSCRQGNMKRFQNMFDRYGIKGVTPVVLSTFQYMKVLASAKYLINDNTFLPFFIKKEGQVYLNTWHGTPLKTLGKGIRNAMHGIGNTQKNFVAADYLLFPNKYTMEHMVEDYMLDNLATGKIMLAGYPRNTIFHNEVRRNTIKKALGIQGKKIYAYMPTWRGAIGKIDVKVSTYMKYYLYEIDKNLRDDEILYLNLHPIAKKDIDCSEFKHIRNFPAQYETYDFLNCAQCLITDYSSVFYDYAITRNKCILFTFDEEEYFRDRGVYKSLSELPFPNVKNVDDLIRELRTEKQYSDEEFINEYCAYDCPEATKGILDVMLLGKKSDKVEVVEFANNGKKNIILYVGNLDRNGITTSVNNLLASVDTTENNYFVTFTAEKTWRNQAAIANLPEGVNYFPIQGMFNLGIIKKRMWLSFKKKKFPLDLMMKLFKKEWQYEIARVFGGARFDSVIQFNGYEPKMLLMFSQFDAENSVFVHSDMVQEIKTRGNQREDVLKYVYSEYDHVVLVTQDIWDATATFVKNTDNFTVVNNLIAVDRIRSRGEGELKFDKGVTKSNHSLAKVKEALDSDAKVLVCVGRFSPEKAHKRTIDAFNKVWQENNEMYLVIIGGNQRDGLYNELCRYVATLPCKDNVILILSMSNPLPLVKACDGFILGSYYEGFGLVIVEADILGVPAVSTDITGPGPFMRENNGTLVENSDEGIEQAIRMLVEGKVPLLTADYDEYNKRAIEEFKKII